MCWKDFTLYQSTESQPASPKKRPSNKRSSGSGFIFFAIAAIVLIVGVLVFFFVGRGPSAPGVFDDPALKDVPLPDGVDASQFDPIASYPQVLAFAGDGAQIITITANYVRADGTVDLTANYATGVEYDFGQKLAATPQGAPPVGAGGSQTGAYYQPIYVKVFGPAQHKKIVQGMERIQTDGYFSTTPFIAPTPTCSFKKLWTAAIEKGVPRDAVAKITYYSTSYSFSIEGTGIRLSFSLDCHISSATIPTPRPAPTDVPAVTP